MRFTATQLRVTKVTGIGWGRREKVLRQLRRKLDGQIRRAAESGRTGVHVETKKTEKAAAKKSHEKVAEVKKGAAAQSMKRQMPKLDAGVRAGSKSEKLATAAPAKKKDGPSMGREGSVSYFMRKLILERKSNQQILAEARKRYPKAKIADHWPQWYRSQMVRAGFDAKKVAAP